LVKRDGGWRKQLRDSAGAVLDREMKSPAVEIHANLVRIKAGAVIASKEDDVARAGSVNPGPHG